MLTVATTFALALLITTVLGIPLASRLASVHVWRRTALPDMPSDRTAFIPNQFTPVDFGPVKMAWPSEIDRPFKGMPEPDWPSAGWNDEHFGRLAPPPTMEDGDWPRHLAQSAASAEAAHRQAAIPPSPQRERAETGREKRVREAQAARADRREEAQSRPKKARKKAQKTRRAPEQPAAGRSDLPDSAQIERMVSDLGLAGTVQHLMKTQGWDFKTAAGWLGRARR